VHRRSCHHQSREPGICISADAMRRDPALASVRDRPWFAEILAQTESNPEPLL